ncbi:MAG: mechanosensitive ion channel family protein [Kiritimatiellae bacterium]|nr:mechanosensitive ion channel family protein [Kiritimatiellia bacterium]
MRERLRLGALRAATVTLFGAAACAAAQAAAVSDAPAGVWETLIRNRIAGSSLLQWLLFASVLLLGLVVGRLARHIMEKTAFRLERKRAVPALILRSQARPAALLVFAGGLSVGLLVVLSLDPRLQALAVKLSRVLLTAGVGYAVYRLVDVADHLLARFAARTQNRLDDMLAPLVGRSVRITIFVLVILQIVQAVSDQPLTTILAGLGVGGLAVALAGQDTIKNFFGSLVILADKPFQIGERVVIDGHDGLIEGVGFRSTRIRRLDGHLVTVPNGELVNKSIENIGRSPFFKRVTSLTITYDTPPAKVERAVQIIRDILADHEGMNPALPPRVYFGEFGACSLDIVVYYWYHPADWWKFSAFNERVNMAILRQFNEAGIEFAFPTQTLYLANDDKRQLGVRLLDQHA